MNNIFTLSDGLFTPQEKWGDYTKLSGALLLLFFQLRKLVGYPFVVHCAYETSGHTDTSSHYRGEAIDFHVERLELKDAISRIESALEFLQMWERVGLGVYLDWNNPGFHLDVRGYHARWGRINKEYVSWLKIKEALK